IQATGGAVLNGSMTALDTRYIVRPGGLAGLSVAFRVLDGSGYLPFVLLGASASISAASTVTLDGADPAGLVALDARASITVGKTLADVLSPYVALRGFYGPIFWQIRGNDTVGTDRYHYQVAAGFVVSVAQWVDVYLEL